ncbi:stage 0 sporulation family protein [uncultured Tyzzerella sp.]|uniref:PSP1 domain-containing protein n=1 Tax=uncultured Tyzzerella sp. TaxID=2321398 RepID=UPI0029439E8A|nr:stage 0 sporulation family protein [uncultured Tyzzerella sp.]
MTEIIGVKFKKGGKMYYFDPKGKKINKKQPVIVETAQGIRYGIVEVENKIINNEKIDFEIKPIIRIATEEDNIQYNKNLEKEKEAHSIFVEKVKKYNLDMKLIDVSLTYDLNKIIFYFTSDGRVDFRELVKELAAIFKMRIELRQIGVRDEAKIVSGIGICGRPLCCATFLRDFHPVSIKMAKDQKLSLNPTKISGACGRLMCCLKYEQEAYEELTKDLPNEGDIIKTDLGIGEVLSVNVLRQVIKAAVRKTEQDIPSLEFFNVSEIEIIKRKIIKEEICMEELKGIED